MCLGDKRSAFSGERKSRVVECFGSMQGKNSCERRKERESRQMAERFGLYKQKNCVREKNGEISGSL